jgi:hypothetical protein
MIPVVLFNNLTFRSDFKHGKYQRNL